MVSAEVEFLQERLALLESWLESTKDDGNNDDLIEKREEYRGLIEETILLQKKLRKTIKLLSTEQSEKMLQKLAKKQDQYLGEIDEIMNYAETDVLFETAEIEPNELLGEPLETLVEQPGLEGSTSSLRNFSLDDFMPNGSKAAQLSPSDQDEFQAVTDNNGSSYGFKNNDSATYATDSTSLFTASTGQSNANNYDERTLRKKLKKVEKLLAAEEELIDHNKPSQLDAIQIKKLNKKFEQYTQALINLQHNMGNGASSPMTNDDRDQDPLSLSPNDIEGKLLMEETNEELDELIYEEIVEEEEYFEEEILDDEEDEVENYEIGEDDDFDHEQIHDNPDGDDTRNQNDHIGASYDRKTLKKKMKKLKKMMEATNDATELELLKQKKKEYKLALQSTKKQDNGDKTSSHSRSKSQHEQIETEEIAHSHSQQSGHDNFPPEVDEDEINALKKKLRKADKAIEKARKEGDPKKLKKMEKKRLEYQTTLDELLFTGR